MVCTAAMLFYVTQRKYTETAAAYFLKLHRRYIVRTFEIVTKWTTK